MKKSFRKILKALLFYAIIIAAWAVLQYLFTEVLKWANPDIFVSPLFVARMFNKLIFLNANSFWSQAGATMLRLFAGYLMSVAVGILLAALISMNLALLNILPIPALDGGHLMFLIIEKIIGKPLDDKVIEKISSVFFSLLIVLMVFVIFNDITLLIKK